MDGRLRPDGDADLAVRGAAPPDRDPARRGLKVPSQDDVERELRRVTERIVSLGPARLARPSAEDGVTPVERVRALNQWLADAVADVEGRERRAVPELGVHALADQLAVLARDALLTKANQVLVDDVHQHLVALRRAL